MEPTAPSWQCSILAVNLFLLARGGVAAGLVVQAARNHATDAEQEEGHGQHCLAPVCGLARGAAARARAPVFGEGIQRTKIFPRE